jgi:hypothetical protein
MDADEVLDTPLQARNDQQHERFTVRVVVLDSYMARPTPGLDICYSQLEGAGIDKVPVIQIYGSTPGGQKTCVHLHKVLQGASPMLCVLPFTTPRSPLLGHAH